MNPFWGQLHGLFTVTLMTLFIGIWIWAWRKRHKPVFDRMSQLPMQDELAGRTLDAANQQPHKENTYE